MKVLVPPSDYKGVSVSAMESMSFSFKMQFNYLRPSIIFI